MRRVAITDAFDKKLFNFLKQHGELTSKVDQILQLLEANINHPLLKTHKLHGKLSSTYACKINHKYRLLFSFDTATIYLESIGSHDDVY